MPLHPVPIIMCTTLAVVGGGYAFKKFIYDPHLAPLLEALLAAHASAPSSASHQLSSHMPASRHRHGEPVSVPVAVAHTTARKDYQTTLRRRSKRASEDYELRQHLLHDHRQPSSPPLVHRQPSSPRVEAGSHDQPFIVEGGIPITGNTLGFDTLASSPSAPRSRRLTQPLIDLHDRPSTPQDAEVRQVIFNYHPSLPSSPSPAPPRGSLNPFMDPSRVTPDIHASPSAPPISLRQPGQTLSPRRARREEQDEAAAAESTTFSFLSLSQASSPQTMLHSLSFGEANERLAERDEDVMSLPESSMSYEDAEAYSPGVLSPQPRVRLLGLESVLEGQNGGERAGHGEERPRGPMSVISMESEDEWEALSSGTGVRL